MKKCEYCAEEIQDEAIKCKHCGEFLNKPSDGSLKKTSKVKWYFSASTIVIGFLCVGPFILPLVWINPSYSLKKKIIITIVISVLTYFMIVMFENAMKTIKEYYNIMSQMLDSL